jgi:hypothetical protein
VTRQPAKALICGDDGDNLRELVEAEKLIASPTDWERTGRRFGLKLPLEIDGEVVEQFFFRATALAHLPDQQVVFQLEYHGVEIPGGNGPLCRLEWKPKGFHDNKGRGPEELRFTKQWGGADSELDPEYGLSADSVAQIWAALREMVALKGKAGTAKALRIPPGWLATILSDRATLEGAAKGVLFIRLPAELAKARSAALNGEAELQRLRELVQELGLRDAARQLGVDPSNLRRRLSSRHSVLAPDGCLN